MALEAIHSVIEISRIIKGIVDDINSYREWLAKLRRLCAMLSAIDNSSCNWQSSHGDLKRNVRDPTASGTGAQRGIEVFQ